MKFKQPHFGFASPVTIQDYVACTGADDGYKPVGDAPTSTQAQPGSPEKLAILIERVNAGVDLWHPDDLTDDKMLSRLVQAFDQMDQSSES